MKNEIVIGMPHLLANKKLNLNHIAKVTGDYHWRYQNDMPSDLSRDGKRVYNSFLRIHFNLDTSIKEDDVLNITTVGEQLDSYIYKSTHTCERGSVEMYTIGIHVDDHKVVKTSVRGDKYREFWESHKAEKQGIKISTLTDVKEYNTCYLTDFNSAGILYCANYINFAYRYMDFYDCYFDIKHLDFYGNIEPNEIIYMCRDGDNLVMLNQQQRPIAKFKK